MIKKVSNYPGKTEVFILTYNENGLISKIHNNDKLLLYDFQYSISDNISDITIINFAERNKYTHRYKFMNISADKQIYNLKYYPAKGSSMEMTYSFNKNGTMSEVYRETFDKNGVPAIEQKNPKRKVYSKIDLEGNWVEQRIGSTVYIRDITYQ